MLQLPQQVRHEIIRTQHQGTGACVLVLGNNPRRRVVIIIPPQLNSISASNEAFSNNQDAMWTFSGIQNRLEYNCVLHGPIPTQEWYVMAQMMDRFWTLEVIELP